VPLPENRPIAAVPEVRLKGSLPVPVLTTLRLTGRFAYRHCEPSAVPGWQHTNAAGVLNSPETAPAPSY